MMGTLLVGLGFRRYRYQLSGPLSRAAMKMSHCCFRDTWGVEQNQRLLIWFGGKILYSLASILHVLLPFENAAL